MLLHGLLSSKVAHPRRSIACLALAVAGVCVTPHGAGATSAETSLGACSGTVTWDFAPSLTLGFTSGGTVSQSWTVGSVCNAVAASVSPSQVNASLVAALAPRSGTASFTGSCIVATAGVSSFAEPGMQGLLVGGSVFVAQPYSPPGSTGTVLAEVDVLTTTSPCNETTATGTGIDAAAVIAVAP